VDPGVPAVSAPPMVMRPIHGGTVVPVGQHPVEVVANSRGEVRAYVRSPHPPVPQDTRMMVHVPDAQGARHQVRLVWGPSGGAYVGRARRVEIAPGPLDVSMVVDGERYAASAPSYVIVQAPPLPPEEVVEVPDEEPVLVQRPQPTVVVQRPQPQIVVERPRPV